jgi:hypothetical protein
VEKQNVKSMVQSLIYQICKQNPTVPPTVARLWDPYRTNKLAQEPNLKDDLLPALKDALVGFQGIYIILDGLDECPSDNGDLRTLLDTLTTIYNWSATQLHMLITSRFTLEIHAKLSSLMTVEGNVKIDLHHIKEMDNDIRTFILAELGEHSTWPEEANETVATALISKAEGMYVIFVVFPAHITLLSFLNDG